MDVDFASDFIDSIVLESIIKDGDIRDPAEMQILSASFELNDHALPLNSTKGICVNCGEEASLSCKGCSGYEVSEGLVTKEWYCSSNCQKNHWLAHRKLCSYVRRCKELLRASELLKRIFLNFAEHMSVKDLTGAERLNGKIYLQHKKRDTVILERPDWNKWTEEEKEILLSEHGCTGAIIVTHALLPRLLHGKPCQWP